MAWSGLSFLWLAATGAVLILNTELIEGKSIAKHEDDGHQQLTEADYYKIYYRTMHSDPPRVKRQTFSHSYRPGQATETNSCQSVRAIPANLRSPSDMPPKGLDPFYQKYTEAYGIPVVASSNVRDSALSRACYTLRFLLADHSGIRQSFYRLGGFVTLIGEHEQTTDIPEFSYLDDWWNDRARGLGATVDKPASTAGEENALCLSSDRWSPEDIVLHEYAHAIETLGAGFLIPGFGGYLYELYVEAKTSGLWANTYSLESAAEYFAEGVQSFFNVNDHRDVVNGIHGPISNRDSLKSYDPKLYDLILQVFPCANTYLKRCQSTRAQEDAQQIQMNCDQAPSYSSAPANCSDNSVHCPAWAVNGECINGTDYMNSECQSSCNVCGIAPSTDTCRDQQRDCSYWASIEECTSNPGFMFINCPRSCKSCPPDNTDPNCHDDHNDCRYWAIIGECTNNSNYMNSNCKLSCNICTATTTETAVANNSTTGTSTPAVKISTQSTVSPVTTSTQSTVTPVTTSTSDPTCVDIDWRCGGWQRAGHCRINPSYLNIYCKKSCRVC